VIDDVYVHIGDGPGVTPTGSLGPLGRHRVAKPRTAAMPLTITLGVLLGVVWTVLAIAAWIVYARIPSRASRKPLALGLWVAGVFVPPLLIGPIVLG